MMTPRARVEAALNHTQPDRTPVFEYVLLSPLADALLGRPCAAGEAHWAKLLAEKGWQGAVGQIATDRLDLACRLGHDMMYVTPNPLPPACGEPGAAAGARPPADDPVAAVAERNERAAGADPSPAEESFLIYHALREEMRRRGIDLPILAPAYLHGVWSDVDLMMTMELAPAVAHRHFRLATRRALKRVKIYVSLGVDQVGVGGDFAGNRPLISPRAYREFIVPEVRTVSRRLHAAGLYAVNASDGNLWPVIDDFLLGCEVDGYLEIDLHAGMDLGRLKGGYGEKVAFYGNLDCGNTLSFAAPEAVRRHVVECIQAGLGNGGHILCASNAITESVPLENYLAVIGAYRDFFGLPPVRLP